MALRGDIRSATVKLAAADVIIDQVTAGDRAAASAGGLYANWGAPYSGISISKDEMGICHLSGVLRIPVAVTEYVGDQIGTAPVGMRPAITRYMSVHGSTGTGADLMPVIISVTPGGTISIFGHQFFMATTVEKYLSVDNVRWPAADSVIAYPSGVGIGGGVNRRNDPATYLSTLANDAALTPQKFEVLSYFENGCTVYKLPSGRVIFDGEISSPSTWIAGTTLMTLPPEFRGQDASKSQYFAVAWLDGGAFGQGVLNVRGDGIVYMVYTSATGTGGVGTKFYVSGLSWLSDRPVGSAGWGDQRSQEPLDRSLFPADTAVWTATGKANGWIPYGSAGYFDEAHQTDLRDMLAIRGLIKLGVQSQTCLTNLPLITGQRILFLPSSTAAGGASWRRVDLIPGAGLSTAFTYTTSTNGADSTSGWTAFDGVWTPKV